MLNRAFVAACLIALGTTAAAQTPAQKEAGPPVVVTTGEATIKRVPDRAWVTIAAESRARTPREVQKMNADAMSAVMQKLKTQVAADAVKTTAYDLQPEFDYRDGRQTLRGYVARNAIEVRVDQIDRVGEIIDLTVGAGATNVSGVRFDLKDRAAAEREALTLAVADARQRADAAAKGAGLTVHSVLRIEERRGVVQPPEPFMRARAVEMTAAAAPPPITPGEVEINVVVTMTATIK